ncbi:MAG: TATA-box-binding protein [Thermoplasmatota archaeon]
MEVKVENVVASATIGESFDLDRVYEVLEGSEYDPEKFKGVIFRIKEKDIGTSVLIFNSGKLVITGALDKDEIERTVDHMKELLGKEGFSVLDDPIVEIQNIVATSDFGSTLNLNNVAISLGLEKIEYEPEQFPGLVYRMDEPALVMLFFGSGKIVCTGGKNIQNIKKGLEKVSKELIDTGFLPEKKNKRN